jgi:carbonic anhydrase
MIRELVKLRRLAIVGAIYHVETGAVEFLEPAG